MEKPKITNISIVARSKRFVVESVDLQFNNGKQRKYERMRSIGRDVVMIVPIIDSRIILIREYALGIESYEIGFPKGLMDKGETIFQAANRELMEEIGFGAKKFTLLKTVTILPAYFSNRTHIVLAEGLYPQKLKGDEPEVMPLLYWPIIRLMALLEESDFHEARNISALFLIQSHLLTI